MKDIKAKDLREKSVEELEKLLDKEKLALHELRRKAGFRDLKDTTSIKVQRHNIARILTVIGEKKRGTK